MIKLTDLFLQKDKITFTEEVALKAITIGQQVYPIIDDKMIVRLHLVKVNEDRVTVEGAVTGKVIVDCDRCMAETVVPLDFSFERQLSMEADGYLMDVEELVRKESVLNFPAKLLCSEDCLGLCPTCGKELNKGQCECAPVGDFRLAGLMDLYNSNFKEEV